MKIAVLDGYALNPGDLSWDWLKELGECRIFDRTKRELIVERASGAEIVLTNKTPFDEATLKSLPELKYICVLATGYNIVDVQAAKALGIGVSNIPEYSSSSVAQMVFALALELARNAGGHAQSVRDGAWASATDFCFWKTPQIELNGLTLGILGPGKIGLAVAKIGEAFGMKVIASGSRKPLSGALRAVGIDELFRESDILSLHCPLSPQTAGIVNAERLRSMKPSSFLINTARGGLIVESELASALENGWIAGAGLDVLSSEPPKPDNPLLKVKNCVITPHIAWATEAARKRLMEIAGKNVRSYLAGSPSNLVS